jgi:hypothetical protein
MAASSPGSGPFSNGQRAAFSRVSLPNGALPALPTAPPRIVDSCNNAFVVQLKMPKYRDLMIAHLALSEKGFVDEHYQRYISRMEVARRIVKLGYSRDKREVQPMLAEALMVPAREPTDAEIYRRFLMP